MTWWQIQGCEQRDKNYTTGKIDKRRQQIEESVQWYLDAIETADRTSPTGFAAKAVRLHEKIACLRREMCKLAQIRKQPDRQPTMTNPDARSMGQAVEAPSSSGTTYRSRWTQNTTLSLHTK